MKRIYFLLTTLFLFLVEHIFLVRLPILGITIPLMLAFAFTLAIVGNEWDVLLVGVFSGFLLDIYANHLYGMNMLLNLYLMLALFHLKKYLRTDNHWLMALCVALTVLLRYGIEALLLKIVGVNANFMAIPVYGLLALPFAFLFLYFLNRHWYSHRRMR